MAYYVGDIPAVPFVVEPPETIDIADYDTVTATLVGPDGVLCPEVDGTIDDGNIVLTFPSDASLFVVPGIFDIRIRLEGSGATMLPPLPVVVQPIASGWHTLDTIRSEWPDAEYIGDATLWELLDVVKIQVLTFAPALAENAPVPANYRLGQRLQTRNVWNATKVAPDGSSGSDDFVIRPFPLDWHVKAILRPKSGIPVIG